MFLLSFALVIVALDCALLIAAGHLPPASTVLAVGFFLPLAAAVAINLDLHQRILLHPLRGWLRRRRPTRPRAMRPGLRSVAEFPGSP